MHMSDKKEKPSIEKVTIGEADEYFNDLGLAYNTDYKDVSKEISDGKIQEKKTTKEGTLEDNLFDLIESMYDQGGLKMDYLLILLVVFGYNIVNIFNNISSKT